MDLSKSIFLFVLFLSSLLSSQVMASTYHDHYLKRHGGISKFRLINRRSLIDCPVDNPYLSINVSTTSPLPDESYVTVTVNGVLHPDNFQWIAMISPSNSSVSGCPLASLNYIQTGDLSNLPLLCHYPVKMRLTWVSGDQRPQQVQYANGKSSPSVVTTFTKEEMCSFANIPSPAQDFGWHEPGYIHSTVMTGLQPSSTYTYRYGSDLVGWSKKIKFKTPPVGGSNELRFIVYGDMGKAPLDPSVEHYIQPGSISVTSAINRIIKVNNIDSIFHIGDISYATGFLAEWEYFLNIIEPYASRISYMTAIGNHERDYFESGSVYPTPDSGGECGVPYESYFQMPVSGRDKPWYSIEQGPVHFTIISTEHTWSPNSTQYRWIEADFLSVNRTRTPWLIFAGHRPMYSSTHSLIPSVDTKFRNSIEPLLLKYKVDLVLFGHVHNYERTCAIYQYQCKGVPRKGKNGIDTYYNSNYTAPVHVIVGMAGFSLDSFPSNVKGWSLARNSEYGFARVSTTRNNLQFEFVNSTTMEVRDKFRIVK
ncbi:nucleotide pyrophosphatase/phosphodiesterase-like isoform X2 [Carex rostrata]